jgi:hypothetical protein
MTLVSETLGRADDEVAFPMDLPSARARCRELLLGAFGLDDQGPLRRAVGRVQPGLAGNRPKLKDAGMESRPLIGSRVGQAAVQQDAPDEEGVARTILHACPGHAGAPVEDQRRGTAERAGAGLSSAR